LRPGAQLFRPTTKGRYLLHIVVQSGDTKLGNLLCPKIWRKFKQHSFSSSYPLYELHLPLNSCSVVEHRVRLSESTQVSDSAGRSSSLTRRWRSSPRSTGVFVTT